MKKNAVLIIIIFVVPMLLFFVSGKVAAAGTRETVENAYGYKISLVRYDGTGEPHRLGSPILIVHPSMMDEPTFTTGSGVPSSHDELMSGGGKYNLDQVFNPDWPNSTAQEVDLWLGESYNQSETLGAYPTGSVNNPFLNFSGGGLEDCKLVKYETVQEQQFSPACKSCSKER